MLSPSGWDEAIAEFGTISTRDLPSEQLGSLVAAAKSIYTLFDREQDQRSRDVALLSADTNNPENPQVAAAGGETISGDDFLPIFIWVTVHTDVEDLPQICRYILELAVRPNCDQRCCLLLSFISIECVCHHRIRSYLLVKVGTTMVCWRQQSSGYEIGTQLLTRRSS